VRTEDGILTWKKLEPAIRPKVYYRAQTGLISLENTHNIAGGRVLPLAVQEEICDNAHGRGIPVHLDAARIFNAAAATGKSVAELTRKVDSIMFCLSKGLGGAGGLDGGGLEGVHRKGARVSKNVRRRDAAGGVLAAADSSRWRNIRRCWRKTTSEPSSWRSGWRRFPASASIPTRWRPTSSSSTSAARG
jgi:threonine aldolase